MKMIDSKFEFLHGRTTKKLIELQSPGRTDIDMSTVTVHLTQVGANQDLRVKRHQGTEVHLSHQWTARGLLLHNCGWLLDKDA